MSVSMRHILHQGPPIRSSLALVLSKSAAGGLVAPGPVLTEELKPRPKALVDAYLRVVGGDPKAWKGQLPPHFFPQWGWALLTRALRGVPYDLKKVVNAGCAWTVNAPLPADEPLQLSGQLVEVDDNGRRALLTVKLTTGTASAPDALESQLTVFIPLPKPKRAEGEAKKKGPKKPGPQVPEQAREIGQRKLKAGLGRDFALVTGDPNPIHWLGPYARMMGFKGCILHGFGTAAIAAETLIHGPLCGDVSRLRGMTARFTRPVPLPGQVRIFTHEGGLFVGKAPGGPANLVGEFSHV